MKILHFEDEPVQSEILLSFLKYYIPQVTYINYQDPYVATILINIHNPDVLICDYYFRDEATIKDGLVQALKTFPGAIYIYSVAHVAMIRKIFKEYGIDRDDIHIFSKNKTSDLIKHIAVNLMTVKV